MNNELEMQLYATSTIHTSSDDYAILLCMKLQITSKVNLTLFFIPFIINGKI